MIHYPAPPIPDQTILDMQVLRETGVQQEELILRMRQAGLHIIQCMTLMRRFYGLGYAEAKELVHHSGAWADLRVENDRLHATAFQALDEAEFTETPAQVLLAVS